jgi:hypothetical protein
MNADRSEVQVVQLATDGSGFSVERRDEVEVSLENRNKNLRIDLFTHRDGDKELVDVVFPTLDQSSSWTALAYTRRNIDGFSLEKEGILVPAGDDFGHQTPDVAYDRENDQVAVVWRRLTSGAASLGVGKYPLSNPSMLERSMLSNSGLASPSDAGAPVLQRVERGFAGGWTYGGATTWAHYLSSEVRPICTPTNSSGE